MASDAVIIRFLTNAIVETIYKRSNNAWRFGIGDGADRMVFNETTKIPFKIVYPESAGDFKSDVLINPTVFPLPVGEKQGQPNEYSIDLLSLKPQRVGDFDELISNRRLREDLTRNQVESLNEVIAERAYKAYAPNNAHFVNTTGAGTSITDYFPGAPAASIKKPTYANIVRVMKIMRDQNLPGRWFALGNSTMIEFLELDPEFLKFEQNTQRFTPMDGARSLLARWGIQLFERSDGVRFDAGNLPLDFAAALSATDQPSIIFWNENAVRYNDPFTKQYVNRDKAEYLASIYNMAMAVGHTKHRQTDQKGTAVLIGDTV